MAVSYTHLPCAAACGMDAIESDELGRAKINYDKCVSCGMCLVNCPFAAIADKSQIFQVINAMNRGSKVIACVDVYKRQMWSRVNRSFTLMGTAVSLWPVVSYTIRVTPVSTLSMAEVSRLSPSKSVSV